MELAPLILVNLIAWAITTVMLNKDAKRQQDAIEHLQRKQIFLTEVVAEIYAKQITDAQKGKSETLFRSEDFRG